jgi:hypothetical protein
MQLVPGYETAICIITGLYFLLALHLKESGHYNFTLERALKIVVTDNRKVYFSKRGELQNHSFSEYALAV